VESNTQLVTETAKGSQSLGESLQHSPLAHDDFTKNFRLLQSTRDGLTYPRGFYGDVVSSFYHFALLALLDKVGAKDFTSAIAEAREKSEKRSAEITKREVSRG
jgi:hypothetical protein